MKNRSKTYGGAVKAIHGLRRENKNSIAKNK
jgi:hypothetical protein